MAKPFDEVRERLLKGGVAPRHVRRYLAELRDHLADLTVEEEHSGLSRSDAVSAALVRLGGTDELARALIDQRQFQSWCARAPWAVFGLAPVALLAGAYLVACLILWSGWRIFLPASDSPFVRIDGVAILYFGFGRLLYFGAPVLTSWVIGLIAVRQRLRPVWPAIGLVLSAALGAMAHIHAGRTEVPAGIGHISMDFGFGPSIGGVSGGLAHAVAILSFSVLPILIWRLGKALPRRA